MLWFWVLLWLFQCCPVNFKTKAKSLKGKYEIVDIYNRRHVYKKGNRFIYFQPEDGEGIWVISDAVGKAKAEGIAFIKAWSVTIISIKFSAPNARWISVKKMKPFKASLECAGVDLTMFFFADNMPYHGYYLHKPFQHEYLWQHVLSDDTYLWKNDDNRWIIGDEPFSNRGVAYSDEVGVTPGGYLKGEWNFMQSGVWDTSPHIGIITGRENTEQCNSVRHERTIYEELIFFTSIKTQNRNHGHTSIVQLWNDLRVSLVGIDMEGLKSTETIDSVLQSKHTLLDICNGCERLLGEYFKIGNTVRPRRSLFLQSKVWPRTSGFQKTLDAFSKITETLGTSYLDSYLIVMDKDAEYWEGTWEALQKLYAEGLVYAIGFSLFDSQLPSGILKTSIAPHMLQSFLDLSNRDNGILEYSEKNDVWLQSVSSLTSLGCEEENNVERLIHQAGSRYNKTSLEMANKILVQQKIGVILHPTEGEQMKGSALWDIEIEELGELLKRIQQVKTMKMKDEL